MILLLILACLSVISLLMKIDNASVMNLWITDTIINDGDFLNYRVKIKFNGYNSVLTGTIIGQIQV